MESSRYPVAIIDRIATLLEDGLSLSEICRIEGLPSKPTVYRWMQGNDELAARLRQSREIGFLNAGDAAVEAAKAPFRANPTDPQAARLAFDAERWRLGKLSNAFADRPLVEATVNVAGDDALVALKGVLDRAAAAIASSGGSTHQVALPSPSGSDNAAGD